MIEPVDDAWDAVVLAGGRGSRLGGVDKAAVEVGGRTLLDHALDAVRGARRIVVVGPERPVPGIVWAREDPPGGGPVAGLAAGIALVTAPRVAVLAVDQPGVTAATVARLVAVGESAVLVDRDGREQWLTGVWRTDDLRAALPADPRDRSVRSVVAPLLPVRVAGSPEETSDVDTPGDLGR
ncbi:Molybdenum cofactor guanylyltransferase [Actinosynnema sp. ALI-1.44]